MKEATIQLATQIIVTAIMLLVALAISWVFSWPLLNVMVGVSFWSISGLATKNAMEKIGLK